MPDDEAPRTLVYMRPEDLPPDAQNAKTHDDAWIARSITEHGVAEVQTLDERTGLLIAGHGRRDAYMALESAGGAPPGGVVVDGEGRWLVPVLRGWASRDDNHAKAALIGLNRGPARGGWDEEKLTASLVELSASGWSDGLELAGYSASEFDELLVSVRGYERRPGEGDEDEVPDAPVEPVTQRGDLWLLGHHRLLCGDAREQATWAALLGDAKADMVWTDPPYGMKLDTDFDAMHTSPDHHDTGYRFSAVIGDDSPFDAAPFIAQFDDVAEQFWFGADYYRSTIEHGGSWVVWDKRWDDGMGDKMDAALGAQFELCWSRRHHRREIARVLWSGHHGMQRATEDTKSRVHPTQKPVDLVRWFFDRWGKAGDIVVDPFGGSGTTLIAAQCAGRVAFSTEIDPAYCDVICARYERLTGVKPTLEATGQPHSFLTDA